MVEGPDGQMMSKKAYKKLMKKLEKEKKKAESEWLGSDEFLAQKRVQAEQSKAKKNKEDDTAEYVLSTFQ